jgi:DNA-binding NarL/FixJ family response regulator
MIKVLVAEDNNLMRSAVIDLLTAAGDIEVVAECTDGDEVLAEALRTCPDVVLMDMAMQRMGGLEATRILLQSCPDTRVVVLTGSLSAGRVREAHALGASGYLLKGGEPEELIDGVRAVAGGGSAWSAPALAFLDHGSSSMSL